MGINGLGTVCDRHDLRDEAVAPRHLQMEGCGRSPDAIRQLVRVDAGNAGVNRGVARTDGTIFAEDRRALERHPGPLDLRADHRLHRGAQQPVPGCEAKDPRVSEIGIHDRHALLRRRETHPTAPLNHRK